MPRAMGVAKRFVRLRKGGAEGVDKYACVQRVFPQRRVPAVYNGLRCFA